MINTLKHSSDSGLLRQEIIEAAHARFLTYGLNKTTMAEIAQDTSMSAANLYRYFKNKQEIASACAARCMSNQNEHLQKMVRQKNLSAEQRLKTFAIESFRYHFEVLKDTPQINQLVENVTQNNPETVHIQIKVQVALIAEILAYGNETGEFSINNIIQSAENIYSMLLLFDVPIFISLFSVEEFEEKADLIVGQIITGIKNRKN